MVATRQKRTIKDTIDFFTNECRDNRLQDVTKDRPRGAFESGIFTERQGDCRFIAYGEEFRDIRSRS